MELTNNEMNSVKGGAVSCTTAIIIGGIVAFLIGIMEGYTNPTECNN